MHTSSNVIPFPFRLRIFLARSSLANDPFAVFLVGVRVISCRTSLVLFLPVFLLDSITRDGDFDLATLRMCM